VCQRCQTRGTEIYDRLPCTPEVFPEVGLGPPVQSVIAYSAVQEIYQVDQLYNANMGGGGTGEFTCDHHKRPERTGAGRRTRWLGPREGRGGIFAPLFAAFDTDKDGSVTRAEMKSAFDAWYTSWDTAKNGTLTPDQLLLGLNALFAMTLPRQGVRGGGARDFPAHSGWGRWDISIFASPRRTRMY
jgi:hypothetical protein